MCVVVGERQTLTAEHIPLAVLVAHGVDGALIFVGRRSAKPVDYDAKCAEQYTICFVLLGKSAIVCSALTYCVCVCFVEYTLRNRSVYSED